MLSLTILFPLIEQLPLSALDKPVIIENKLDDTGRDVVWQALKYTSYCSTLTNIQIIKCPTIREYNGLAKSSRNKHLDIINFNLASNIYKVLKFTKKNIKVLGVQKTKEYVVNYLNNLVGINLEYFEIINSESFSFTNTINPNSSYYGLIAVEINNIRLIDNIKL